jgi:WD40 repeat protein
VDHGFEQDGLCGSVVASGDGRIIAALGTNIVLDRQELSFLELFDTKTFDKLLVKNSSFGRSIAISPDNQRIAVETFGTLALFARVMGGHGEAYLSIFDVASKEWARHIPLKTPMTCSAFSPDGKLILTGSTDPSMIVWDLAKRAETREIAVPDGGVDEIVFSPDGSRIFTASLANNLLSIHKSSGETEKTIATTTQVPGKMSCAALNREGKGVTGHRDGSVVYWDLTTGISGTFRNDGTEVVAVAISRDGRKALASLLNRSVVCYELPMSNP